MEEAIDLLIKTDRIPEAAMLARTYAPDQISKIVGLWKAGLESKNRKKTAESLADPAEYPNLFPELLNKKSTDLVDIDDQVEDEPLVDATEEQPAEDSPKAPSETEADPESPSLI
jgi:coatomer subunit beta'